MMRGKLGLLAPVLIVVLGSCGEAESAPEKVEPAVVEQIPGNELSRISLSASAADRLDIQTTTVVQAGDRLMVPSSAVIIDTAGRYWVYANPEPLVFVREEMESVLEEGTDAFFISGPSLGTDVVTVGVPELYGAEFGLGK